MGAKAVHHTATGSGVLSLAPVMSYSPRQAGFTPKLGIQQDQQRSQSNLMGESLRCYQSVPFAAGWEQ